MTEMRYLGIYFVRS